jgi:hypothetical protein
MGPVYGLGQITVATAGTPVALSANSSLTDGFGTTSSPSPITANTIKVHAAAGNTGNFYLVFTGGNKGTTNNIALVVAPGTTEQLFCPQMANPFMVKDYQADADTSGNTAIIDIYRF